MDVFSKYILTSCFAILFSLPAQGGSAQNKKTDTLSLSLDDAIELAQLKSLDAVIAKHQLNNAYWRFRNYKADFLPTVILQGTTPSFNRYLSNYQNSDGSYSFIPNHTISTALTLSIEQNIPFTGGKIFVQSQLDRTQGLDNNKYTNYLSVPVAFTVSQPLITARPLMWARRIEPEAYEEALKESRENFELISIQTVSYYFNLLTAKVNVEIAEQDLINSEQLYQIALKKRELGWVSENDLQQLQLGKLNAQANLVISQQEYDDKKIQFHTFLGLAKDADINIATPSAPPAVDVPVDQALLKAAANNPFSNNVKRRLFEAEQLIAEARANRGFKADIYVSAGYTGTTSDQFSRSYSELQNRYLLSFGVSIPILDWGKGKGQVSRAQSQAEVVRSSIEKETLSYEQSIITAVRVLQNQPLLLEVYRSADSLSYNRYNKTIETFKIGNVSILDINAAKMERINAQRNYIAQLYEYWLHYYSLRQLTLFDFVTNKDITYENLLRH